MNKVFESESLAQKKRDKLKRTGTEIEDVRLELDILTEMGIEEEIESAKSRLNKLTER